MFFCKIKISFTNEITMFIHLSVGMAMHIFFLSLVNLATEKTCEKNEGKVDAFYPSVFEQLHLEAVSVKQVILNTTFYYTDTAQLIVTVWAVYKRYLFRNPIMLFS